jgi:branched-chain amino acid transport system permease protein
LQFFFDHFFELTITGLALGSVYALVALGYTMVYGVLQLINFAHSEVFMYGTFAVVWVFTAFGANGNESTASLIGLLVLSTIAAALVSGGVALLIERVAYRPLLKRNSPKLVALISAIGASFALSEAMGLRDRITGFVGLSHTLNNYVGNARDNSSLPVTIDPKPVFKIGDYHVTTIDLLVIVVALIMMVSLDRFVRLSRTGRGMRAIAQNPEAAALMGVNAVRVRQVTFLLGGLMAGVAASLYMIRIGTTRFDAGFILGVKAFTAAVMGGIGNLRGALLGGLVLGVAENWGSAIIGTQWKDVVAFVLLVVILLFRPTGLLGESLGRARA